MLCVAALAAVAQELRDVPVLEARVTDLVGVMSDEQRGALEWKLSALEERAGSQIAILVVPSTAPESLEGYSFRVAEAWRLGRESTDDGILLLVAIEDRAVRIEVGYGLEGAVPDARASRIIREIIVPQFAAGDIAGGIDGGAEALIASVDGEDLPAPEGPSRGPGVGGLMPLVLMIAIVTGIPLKRILGMLLGAVASGGVAAVIIWFIFGVLNVALLAGLMAVVINLMSSMGGGPGRWSNGGGGGFGGSGGFGGGGGFSGGGGSFGGGGASGRW